MGGNDLNLKKSWHPQLMTNQRRVYDAEQAALQERKITEARIEEIRRERQIEETQKQLEASGGPKRVDRVDWMYQGPNDGSRDEYSSEAFLLGKRRIDSILRGDDAKKVEKTAGPAGEPAAPIPVVASARDTAAKIREDPLVAIKRQEQEAYQAMMKDPSKRRQLLAQMGIVEEEKPRKDKEERKHRSSRHRSHRHRDDDDRRRRRRGSQERSHSPKRRYDKSDDEGDRKRRRRSNSQDGARDRRRRYDSDERRDDRRDGRRDATRRTPSRSPPTRHENPRDNRRRQRTRSPIRRYDSRGGFNKRQQSRSPVRRQDVQDRRQGRPERPDDAEERARKLAAMQNAATDLDRVREERLAALAEKEKAEREADNAARAKSQKYGGRDFANRLHNSAADSLADRIGRGRQGLQRDDD
ncbi:unnamed protein product [Discula destructiva]